jgi:threonylcarbamoyladenosine tRNA methylthiotransferase MtaB
VESAKIGGMKTLSPPRTVAFLSLGCRVNQAEESTYRQHSLESGWSLVDFRQPADIYIVNTCAVTLEAERQSRQMIRQAKRRNPEAKIVVTGCAGRSLERHPGMQEVADLFVPNLHKDNLVEQLQQFLGEAPHPQFDYFFPPVESSKTTRLNLKITDGCFESCAFCIIPSRRGTVRSLPEDEVIQRLKAAHQLGYKEAILTGVHLGAYGHEHGEHGLDRLLHRINAEADIHRVRLSSIDPHEISDSMIAALKASSRICAYLHIPIQSGSDTVLERMRRRDTRAAILDTVQRLKAEVPDISLTTDMIVGFAGESEADFDASYTLMEALGVHKIHVFPFSIRPGTRAAFMKDHVEPEVKNERVQRLLQLDHRLKTQWMNQWKGRTVELLVENISRDGVVKGYSPHYLRVHVLPEAGATGLQRNQLVQVKITDVDPDNEVALATTIL